jgi:uncharacterized protein (TIGR04255 family)
VSNVRPTPAFDAPPVEEVALAAHFKPIGGLKVIDYAVLADQWAADYPIVEEVPPAGPVPDEMTPGIPQIEIQMGSPPAPRYWFRNESGSKLIQVQRDRLVHNWRRVSGEDYPHYSDLRPLFERALSQLEDFSVTKGAGPLKVNQCEVTYVNPISIKAPLRSVNHLEDLFAPWSGSFSDDFLAQPEGASVAMRFPIPGPDGATLGYLSVSVNPVIRPEVSEHLFLLQLVARGRPETSDISGVMEFLDKGHEWIVRGFASVTTPQMHLEWRRSDADPHTK